MIATAILFLHIATVIFVALKVIFRRLPVGTSLAWIIIAALVPFVGLGAYMLIGDHRLGRKRLKFGDIVSRHYQNTLSIKRGAIEEPGPQIDKAFLKISDVAARATGFHLRSRNAVTLLSGPEEIFDKILGDINAAASSCYLEFYIIDPAGRVIDVLNAIAAASARGVECKIIADHIGSRAFFKSKWPATLESAGVEIVDSLPTGIIKTFFTRSDLRNHRKIVAIDRRVSYTGSFNLADPRLFNRDKNCGPWVDVFARIEGDATEALSVVFNTDYVLETHERKHLSKIPKLPDLDGDGVPKLGDKPVQIIPSGPEIGTSVIYETIISSIYTAQESILITTPYLIPDESLLLALSNAARRGVSVKIIVPEKVDSVLVAFASHSYYGELLRAGIEIFEYEAGLLHSKIILIDHSVAYLGTVNLDMRSFYLNLEITIALHSPQDCRDLAEITAQYIADSKQVHKDDWMDGKRSPLKVFTENLVRLASPLL